MLSSYFSFFPPSLFEWIYAFNIKPRHTCDAMELVQQPEGTTASPFANLPKRPAGETNFFFSVGGGGAKRQQDRRGSAAKRRRFL